MSSPVLAELVEAGVHFGHQTKRWNPKMKKFIMGSKNNIHILNIEETVNQIDKAADFLSELARKHKKVLFVGCKRQAQEAVKQAAEACQQYYVNHRWLGGTLTNNETLRKSIARLNYLEDIEKKPEFKQMSKKELASLNRERIKLERNLRGIRTWTVCRTPSSSWTLLASTSPSPKLVVSASPSWPSWTRMRIPPSSRIPSPPTTMPSAPSASSCRS